MPLLFTQRDQLLVKDQITDLKLCLNLTYKLEIEY